MEETSKQKRLYSFNENSSKHSDDMNSTEILDQLYGEPPPSYMQAKFYPKAPAEKLIGKTRLDDEKSSHIYENIDELSAINGKNVRKQQTSNSLSVGVNNTNIPGKRSKFQGLKKHESYSTTTSNSNSSASKKLRNISKQLSVCPLLTETAYKQVTNNSSSSSSSSSTKSNPSQRIENNISKINSNATTTTTTNNTDTLYYQPKFKTNKNNSEQFL